MAENENKQENVVVEDFKRTNAKKSKKKFRHRQQNPVLAFMRIINSIYSFWSDRGCSCSNSGEHSCT